MIRFLIICLGLCLCSSVYAQGRKLPNISFQENSTEFADANRTYNDNDQYTDTLHDERIVKALAGILEKNPELLIELGGHVDMNEDTSLGQGRAQLVYDMLMMEGVDESRMTVINYARNTPIIADEVVTSLPSAIERNAANQRNRRVEVKVVGKRQPEESESTDE